MHLKHRLFNLFMVKFIRGGSILLMKNKYVSSDELVYKKYRIIEIVSFIIIIIGGIVASLSQLYYHRGGNYYVAYICLIVFGSIIIVGGLISFLIYYFKIKKLKEKND